MVQGGRLMLARATESAQVTHGRTAPSQRPVFCVLTVDIPVPVSGSGTESGDRL